MECREISGPLFAQQVHLLPSFPALGLSCCWHPNLALISVSWPLVVCHDPRVEFTLRVLTSSKHNLMGCNVFFRQFWQFFHQSQLECVELESILRLLWHINLSTLTHSHAAKRPTPNPSPQLDTDPFNPSSFLCPPCSWPHPKFLLLPSTENLSTLPWLREGHVHLISPLSRDQ